MSPPGFSQEKTPKEELEPLGSLKWHPQAKESQVVLLMVLQVAGLMMSSASWCCWFLFWCCSFILFLQVFFHLFALSFCLLLQFLFHLCKNLCFLFCLLLR